MLPNETRMIAQIGVFAVVNLAFMAVLFYYLKAKRAGDSEPVDPELIKIDPELALPRPCVSYLKLCFLFAAAYLAVFLVYKNTGISCKKLDKRAQCVCYAMEAKNAADPKDRITWATRGTLICPDSEWFPLFLRKQQALTGAKQ